jgi:hypothetical protein
MISHKKAHQAQKRSFSVFSDVLFVPAGGESVV